MSSEDEKIRLANKCMDILFPYMPQISPFQIGSFIQDKNIPLTQEQRLEARSVQGDIKKLMIEYYFYAEVVQGMNLNIKLTSLGIRVRAAGGHAAYIESLKAKVVTKNELDLTIKENLELQNAVLRFELSIKDLKKDLADAKYINETAGTVARYKKKKWGVIGTISGAAGTLILEHAKDILQWLLKLTHE